MSSPLNINRFVPITEVEGPGIRSCVWFQGCHIRCKGCFAKDLWNPAEHLLYTPEELVGMVSPLAEGITILGGEPFEQNEGLSMLLKLAWDKGLSTIVFTGFTYEYLQKSVIKYIHSILSHIDVLVDGPFIETRKSFDVPLIGSANQRFHFLTNRYSMSDFIKNKYEIRISKNGSVGINGMGNTDVIQNIIKKPRISN
jgi:anaerobic ribonucleoside-triphosphate reductase activating protein